MSAPTTTSNKENNKNAGNAHTGSKKFVRGNASLHGKIFDINSKEAVHHETVKAIVGYVRQEYTHGGDIRYMIDNLQDFNMTAPEDPPANANQYAVESWKKLLDLYWKRKSIYTDNKMKLYSLIWGHSSSKLTQSKLETHQEFPQCKASYESLILLKIMQEFIFKSDDHQYKFKAEDQARRAYYLLRQTLEMSCQEYLKRVRNVTDVLKSLGGTLSDALLKNRSAKLVKEFIIKPSHMESWLGLTGPDSESLCRR
jgi:hypothetical protein